VLRGQDLPKQSKRNTLSAQKLLAWVASELQETERFIAWENNSGHPSLDAIKEFEGRIWAYKLIQQFVLSGCADEEGAVCGACGGTKVYIATGQLVCDQCYGFRGSECSMVPASSEEGRVALQRRRMRQKAGVPENEL
jgi:hypothetical protein